MINLINGDCLEEMKKIRDGSIDLVLTDPPYELGFMGKSWDNTGIANNKEMWAECLRVLKPGGHLLAFSGTRTYHRMASAIEDAGFEVRDMIEWVYGSGFPKSLNIGKAVDKLQGNERVISGYEERFGREGRKANCGFKEEYVGASGTQNQSAMKPIMLPISEEAKQWEGWGTALKPAHEPICMARKPLSEKTVAENCLKWGTGGINIDESRVDVADSEKESFAKEWDRFQSGSQEGTVGYVKQDGEYDLNQNRPQGRFPANLILSADEDGQVSEEVRECFPDVKTGSIKPHQQNSVQDSFGMKDKFITGSHSGDSGNASRFFKSILYYPKASKSERNKGCEGLYILKDNTPKEDIDEIKHLLSV